jgi:NitT/TauT family transport system ATP-binding protein
MTAKLEIKGLCKSFGDLEVLRNIGFQIQDHELLALVGPSGCGKTTLLRMIAGIEKYDAGAIAIDGRSLVGPGPDRGFVFQQDSLFPWRTIWRNAIFGLEINGQLDQARRARTHRLLELVGLSGFEQYYPSQISGGMRQRVNLARALALDPEVLIMDEPFSALDARKTVLFITHQIDEAVFLADRIVVLGRRPGWVKETIDIALPRPRELAFKRRPEFAGYVERVWNLIEKDVRASVEEDAQAHV